MGKHKSIGLKYTVLEHDQMIYYEEPIKEVVMKSNKPHMNNNSFGGKGQSLTLRKNRPLLG